MIRPRYSVHTDWSNNTSVEYRSGSSKMSSSCTSYLIAARYVGSSNRTVSHRIQARKVVFYTWQGNADNDQAVNRFYLLVSGKKLGIFNEWPLGFFYLLRNIQRWIKTNMFHDGTADECDATPKDGIIIYRTKSVPDMQCSILLMQSHAVKNMDQSQ